MNVPDPRAEDLPSPPGAEQTVDQVEKAKKSAEDSGVMDVVTDVVSGIFDVGDVVSGVLSIFDV